MQEGIIVVPAPKDPEDIIFKVFVSANLNGGGGLKKIELEDVMTGKNS